MDNWYDSAISQIGALLVSIAIGFFGNGWYQRRKAKLAIVGSEITNDGAEIDNEGKELGNVKDLIAMYKEGFADIKEAFDLKYNVVIEQYETIKVENAQMKEELSILKGLVEQNNQMQSEIASLQEKVKILEKENNKLRCDIKKLQP